MIRALAIIIGSLLVAGFLFLFLSHPEDVLTAKKPSKTSTIADSSNPIAQSKTLSSTSQTQTISADPSSVPVSKVASVQDTSEDQPKPNVIYLNAGRIDTDLPSTKGRRQPLAYFPGKRMQLIQWTGPVQAGWVEELKKLGVEIIDYIPENAYLVYGDWNVLSAMQKRMADKNYVRWEGAYRPQDKIQPNALAADQQSPANRPEPELFSIQMVLNPKANAETLKKIEQLQLASPIKQGPSGNYYNIVAKLPPVQIASLAEQPDIISIGPYQTPGKRDEKQCIIMAGQLSGNVPTGPGYMDWLANRGFTQAQFDASGLVVDVTDSPIDNGSTNVNHFALYRDGTITNSLSRVVYTRLEGTANTGSVTSAQDGHGNLNAHIIAGQVNLTNSPHIDANGYKYGMGVAPFVKVGGSIIFDVSNFTSPSYDNLAARAYRDGARVSGNSWGADTAGAYDADAQNYDRLVRDAQPSGSAVATAGNQQMTFVFAAGNAGSGTSTVGSPGTAKNVITVGAAENVRAFGGSDGSGIADTGADSANDVISFSSRGPCSDSRKKPDIMAPGTHITGGAPQNVKTMSGTGTALTIFDGTGVSGGVGSNFFPSSGQQFYTASSGTSHSTPGVAGAAALVYQWFINKGWATAASPASPAMIKAYLMNASRYMTGVSANDNLYSNNQGMGMVNLDTSFDTTPRFLRDQLTADIFTASGQSRSWSGTITSSSKPVRITVAWTDAPGSTTGNAYKNNLDLTVVVNGTTYRGNVFSGGNSTTGGTADIRNNVESVFLPAGATGNVTITVAGTNINSDGVPNYGTTIDQDFALVAYNFNEVTAASIVSSGNTLVAEGNTPTNNAIDPEELVSVAFGLKNVGSLDATNVTATLLATNGVTPITTNAVSYGALLTNGVAATNNFQFRVTGAVGNNFDAVLSIQDGTNSLGTVPYTFRIGPPPPIVLNEDFASLTGGSDTSTGGPLSTAITANLTTNFPTSAYAYSAGGAVKLGTKDFSGSITSRALDLSGNGGVFSIKFDVKGWTTVEGQIKVTVGSLPAQTIPYTATISGNYETKTLNFTGGQANSTVKIETTAKRAFIDNVQVLTTASVATPVIYSPLTASGSVGSAFSYSILASNAPTSFGASNLPAGLTNNSSTGVISGTPTAAGTNNVTITASNSGGTDNETLVLTVNPAPLPPVISSPLTANGAIGSAFNYQITASGNPTSYGAVGLPAGLTNNPTTGAISGSPTVAGTFNVTISATNAAGSGSATLALTVASSTPVPVISSATTTNGTVGVAFSYSITASGSPTSYGATGLPAGLSVNSSTGVISGTPNSAGTSLVNLTASNAGGAGTATLVLTINPGSGGGVSTSAILAGWDTAGLSTSSTWAPITNNATTVNTNLTMTTQLTRGTNITVSGSGVANAIGGSGGWGTTPADTNSWIFAFRANAGYSVSVTNLTGFTRKSSTGPSNVIVDVSVNGGAYTNAGSFSTTSTSGTGSSFALVLTNISSLQNVPSGQIIKFRVNPSGTTGAWYLLNGSNALVVNGTLTAPATLPSLAAETLVSGLTNPYGSAATNPPSFTLTASNLTGDVALSSSPGFEISQTAGGASGYAASQTLVASNTKVSNAVFVRLAATNPVGSYSGYVLCNTTNSAGLTVVIPTNTVTQKDITITGLVALDKVYDATTLAAFSGTPAYAGLANGDSFTVSGNPSAAFSSAAVGSGKTVTVTGYNAPSGNYNLLPTSLTASITAKPVAITGVSGVDKTYDGTVTAGLAGTAQVSDILLADVGNVTVAGTPTASFASANVGTDIGITVSGYSLSGSTAANYWPVQPSGLTANINPKSASVRANDQTKSFGVSLNLGPGQTHFTATGLVSGERIGTVTLTANGGMASNAPAGTYLITPSDPVAPRTIPANPFLALNYAFTFVDGTLTVVDAITISDWAANNGLTGTDAAPEADPDGDGMSNLMEFYLGLSPTNSSGAGGGFVMTNGPSNTVSMTYLRAKGVTGVTPAVQASADLSSSNWGTNGVVETVKDAADPRYEEVTATVTNPPGATKMFMRLRVSQP